MEDKTQTNQVQTAGINTTKAPQKVEVVVANSSSGSEVNILGELSIFILRIGFCALMIHHGLEKLKALFSWAILHNGIRSLFSSSRYWTRRFSTCSC